MCPVDARGLVKAYVYVIEHTRTWNNRADGVKHYVGMTVNPLHRWWQHATGYGGAATVGFCGLVRVVAVSVCETIEGARQEESLLTRRVRRGFVPQDDPCCFITPEALRATKRPQRQHEDAPHAQQRPTNHP